MVIILCLSYLLILLVLMVVIMFAVLVLCLFLKSLWFTRLVSIVCYLVGFGYVVINLVGGAGMLCIGLFCCFVVFGLLSDVVFLGLFIVV